MAKIYSSQTFIDPTIKSNNTTPMVIASKAWPTSTHVHGAEVRPTFDGNPLSWISNYGHRGEAAFSLND